ncbi:MAG: glycosyltransferase [Candidatus Gracilibacteria bacterium]|nr:glycosyltransferase [Candidatus Gracilibacteria bacterium]
MSKINLIIPLYNSNYIEKQLISIKKQQNKAIKLIIIFIDDGSTQYYKDIYKNIISKYRDLEIIYNELGDKNGQNRVSKARNLGAILSSSQNLYFIDQETILTKNFINNISKYLDSDEVIIGPYLGYNDLEKQLSESDIDFFMDNGYVNKPDFSDFRLDFYLEKTTQNRLWEFFAASNFFLKKDVFLSVGGFDETITTWGDEDTEFGYRLQKAGHKILFDENMQVLNVSEKLYNKPYKILLENNIETLSNNWLQNYKKHYSPDYKRYIYDRYNHLSTELKQKVSPDFKKYFLNKKNVLIHSINGIGLGHIKRTLLIALQLYKSEEIGEIIFVTNSKNPFLIEQAGFRVLSLEYGIEDCLNSSSFQEYETQNYIKINEIINQNNIDIIIHDTYFIKKVLDNRIDLSHFLVLRDSDLDYLKTIQDYLYSFKKIFIPHISAELSQEKLDFYVKFKNISYTGYVYDNINISSLDKGRWLKAGGVLVSPGYGGDYENTKYFFEYVTKLINSNIEVFSRYKITFVLGKYYDELKAKIVFPEFINISQFDDNLSKSIANCEMFIGRGGYNTLTEVYTTNTKSILFPVDRNAENQDNRIDFFINHFGVDFIKKGSYDLEKDISSLKELAKNSILNPFSNFRERGYKETNKEFLDGKQIISEEILGEINKKNILVFKNIFLPESENFIYEELRLLEVINPIIFTLKMDNNNIYPNNFNIVYKREFDTLLDLEYPKIKDTDLYLKFLKYLVFLIKKYDIKIIYTEFLFDASFIVKIKSIIPDIKIYSAARGYDVYGFLKKQNKFLDNVDKIFVRDEVMRKYIKNSILNPFSNFRERGYNYEKQNFEFSDKIEIVRSVLDFSKYSFVKKDFTKLDILFGGRFVEKKGIVEVLDLISLLVKHDLVAKIGLIGDGELKNDIFKKIDELGLANKIEYFGFLEHKDLLKQINNYNTYINYSKVSTNGDTDGIPNMVLENMLSGNLVFSTLIGGIGEVIIDGETGVVISGKIEDDLEKMRGVFDYEMIVDNAYRKVRDEFGRENSVGKLEMML